MEPRLNEVLIVDDDPSSTRGRFRRKHSDGLSGEVRAMPSDLSAMDVLCSSRAMSSILRCWTHLSERNALPLVPIWFVGSLDTAQPS
jgi:hypothetical protein